MSMAFDQAPFNEDSFMEKEFLRLRDEYGIKTVIETGTYHGVTTNWLGDNFENVYTIECNTNFYYAAQEKFSKRSIQNITSLFGDSVKMLPKIISGIRTPTLVFLDAHWYENPLINELLTMAELKYQPEIICIHDMQNPNDLTMGYDSYPNQGIVYTFEWVKPHIDAVYGEDGYTHYFNKEATGARRGALFIIKK